jgi:hypothetical protein
MSKVKNQFRKQRSKTAKLGTENHRTQDRSKDASFDGPQKENFVLLDVKPTTLN